MKKEKGSLTVFAALSFMLIASVLFTLLEGTRNIELCRIAHMKTDASVESLFACYEKTLWEKYRLLAIDCSDSNGEWSLEEAAMFVSEMAEEADMAETNLLRVMPDSAEISSYMVLTDGEGRAFEAAVASYMKSQELFDLAEETYRNYQSIASMKQEYKDTDQAMGEGQEAVKAQKVQTEENGSEDQSRGKQDGNSESEYNPMDEAERAKKKGITALVLPDEMDLSGKQIKNSSQLLSKRNRITGTSRVYDLNQAWYDKVLMNRYLVETMGCIRSPEESGELCYEVEYILSGKQTDEGNIKSTFNKLLLAREAGNLVYLLSDAAKMKKVSEMSALLAGTSANPAVIGAVEAGILAAWAYAESILDMRTLVNGGKIALIKNSAQWTSSLESIAKITAEYEMAQDCDNGITYEQYLESMLLALPEKDVALRAMDLMERSIQTILDCETIRLDHFMVAAEIEIDYTWNGIFSSFILIGNVPKESYGTLCSSSYSYISP